MAGSDRETPASGDPAEAPAASELRASEQRYRAMVQAASDAMMVADSGSAVFVDANPAACEMFGYTVSELRQLDGRALTAPRHHDMIDAASRELVARGRAYVPRLRVCRKDGTEFWASLRMATYQLEGQRLSVVNLRDVSEQVEREAALAESSGRLRAAQARLQRSERLATLGQLAAAVAHELNNPLQFVDINLDELRRMLGSQRLTPELTGMLDDLRNGIDRIAAITRDLGSLTRIDDHDVGLVDVNEVVQRACRMLDSQLRPRARVTLELSASRPIPADAGKLTQLVTNLLLHVSHALVPGRALDHRIILRTQDQADALLLRVVSTGETMSPEQLEHAFDPGTTIAPATRGGGLGLPVCAEIVRLHRGTIDVRSEPGHGTEFVIRLPHDNGLMAREHVPSRPWARLPEPEPEPEPARARVLLIDDDALVLRGIRRLLASKHDVEIAEGGEAGLALLAADTRFDVVLCDLMMPEVDGIEIHEAVRHRAPALTSRMIFCSGGAFTPRAQAFVESMANPLLKKPVRADDLFEAIERVIAAGAQPDSDP